MKMGRQAVLEVEVDAIGGEVPVEYGEDDIPNDFPGRSGDVLRMVLDLNGGRVLDWPSGRTADLCLKVRDGGTYTLLRYDAAADGVRHVVATLSGYVPDCIPEGGDYLEFRVEADGRVSGWNPTVGEVTAAFRDARWA
jgi:hypothetical protein